jgi:lysophospholipase L1-like esterase
MAVFMRELSFGGLAPFAIIALILAGAAGKELAKADGLGLCILGDSLGVGIATAFHRRDITFTAEAKESTNARQWASTIAEHLPATPSLVVMSLGTNDALSDVLRAEFPAHMRTIARAIHGAGHALVWVLPAGPSLIPDSATLQVMSEENVQAIVPRVEMADKWHPTAQGYDAIAKQVLEHLFRVASKKADP